MIAFALLAMPLVLSVHYAVGLLLFLTALAAIFFGPARRLLDYVLALQIVLGIVTLLVLRVSVPALHWILALAAGGVWAMGRALARRDRPRPVVMGVFALGAVIVSYVIYLGMHAVHG